MFPTLEDAIERSSMLVGSPQQIIDKVLRYHGQFGHSVMHLAAEADGLTEAEHRASLELFQAEVAPVLRREIPDPPWDWDARGGVVDGAAAATDSTPRHRCHRLVSTGADPAENVPAVRRALEGV